MLTDVVDSFSSVFQSAGGVLKSITRHDTRAFKRTWTEFSDPKTRLLERHGLAPFLARLDGSFEVRIYPAEASVQSLLSACQDRSNRDDMTGGINLRELKRKLDQIDFVAIRRRREAYARVYHEANLMCSRTGITSTEMVTLLAHYKIHDERTLTPKELEARTAILEMVTGLVALDKVRSVMRMKVVRKRYLQIRNASVFDNPSRTAVPTHVSSSWNNDEDDRFDGSHVVISGEG